MSSSDHPSILLGRVTRLHGLRGDVKLRCDLENSSSFCGQCCFINSDTSSLHVIQSLRPFKPGIYLLKLKSIDNATQAETLLGKDLYVSRDVLPPLQNGEHYHVDLVGIPVYGPQQKLWGTVRWIHAWGAQDVIEIECDALKDKKGYVPFHETHIHTLTPGQHLILSEWGVQSLLMDEDHKKPEHL